jgi:hypothetical protein
MSCAVTNDSHPALFFLRGIVTVHLLKLRCRVFYKTEYVAGRNDRLLAFCGVDGLDLKTTYIQIHLERDTPVTKSELEAVSYFCMGRSAS